MAKFRERFAILLLSLSILSLIAVLSICHVKSDDPTSSIIPGIETFNNLKRSRLNYEIIDFDLFNQSTITQRFEEVVSKDSNVVEKSRNSNVVVSRNINFLQNMQQKSPENNTNIPHLYQPPNMTIILSESRSGSTWLLDIMSHPANAMLFFEPLNYKPHSGFLASLGNTPTPQVLIKFRQNKLSQICSCNLSTTLMGGVSGWQRNYKDRTGIRMNNVTEHCLNNYQTRIVKTIRLYNISELSELPGLGCSNFKVVHLVRDPRAVLLSRIETFHELYDGNHNLGPKLSGSQRDYDEDYMRRAARDYCSNHMYNFEVGRKSPSWLQNRYKMIKYEDVALDPIISIKSLFSFTNQDFTAEIASFVYHGSHGKAGRGGYGVRKNSSSIVWAWKGRLIWRHVRVIQEECRTFLQLFGYEILREGD